MDKRTRSPARNGDAVGGARSAMAARVAFSMGALSGMAAAIAAIAAAAVVSGSAGCVEGAPEDTVGVGTAGPATGSVEGSDAVALWGRPAVAATDAVTPVPAFPGSPRREPFEPPFATEPAAVRRAAAPASAALTAARQRLQRFGMTHAGSYLDDAGSSRSRVSELGRLAGRSQSTQMGRLASPFPLPTPRPMGRRCVVPVRVEVSVARGDVGTSGAVATARTKVGTGAPALRPPCPSWPSAWAALRTISPTAAPP